MNCPPGTSDDVPHQPASLSSLSSRRLRGECDQPCGIATVLLPLGMSCRGRAEAFARSLQSRLRTLGSQEQPENDPNPSPSSATSNEWTVPDPGPVAPPDAFFDFDLEPESPGSPADCEYQRLIETAATTPLQEPAPLFFDPETSDESEAAKVTGTEFFDCLVTEKEAGLEGLVSGEQIFATTVSPSNTTSISSSLSSSTSKLNGVLPHVDSCESLPPSQSSNSTNSTLQDDQEVDQVDNSVLPAPPPYVTAKFQRYQPPLVSTDEIIDELANVAGQGPAPISDDEEYERPPRVRRCSSLKTGKTPPGTPGRKKIVRFADVLGLDLAAVRTFLDEVPRVPRSAFEDLDMGDAHHHQQQQHHHQAPPTKVLVALFGQPGADPAFLERVKRQQVCLENACVTDDVTFTIQGCVRVRNLDFHKSVHVRYTMDDWRSYSDLSATYVENSCDGFSDKFKFELYGGSLQEGQRLEMAIRFHVKGEQFWDSNLGTNYCFQCMPCASGATSEGSTAGDAVAPPMSSTAYAQLAGDGADGVFGSGGGRNLQWANSFLY